jgi:hypothetical protein
MLFVHHSFVIERISRANMSFSFASDHFHETFNIKHAKPPFESPALFHCIKAQVFAATWQLQSPLPSSIVDY